MEGAARADGADDRGTPEVVERSAAGPLAHSAGASAALSAGASAVRPAAAVAATSAGTGAGTATSPLRFALEGGLATMLASILTTQTVIVVLSWPDLSFWMFAALTSTLVGAALGFTAAAAGLIAWYAGLRTLDTRRSATGVGLAMALAATAVAALVTMQSPGTVHWLWWTVPGAAAVGGAFSAHAIRRAAV